MSSQEKSHTMPIPFGAAWGLWKQMAGRSEDAGCGVRIQTLQSGSLGPLVAHGSEFSPASGVLLVPSGLGYPDSGTGSREAFPELV